MGLGLAPGRGLGGAVWEGGWSHTSTPLCDGIRDTEGIRKEGRRRRKEHEEDKEEEKEGSGVEERKGRKMEKRVGGGRVGKRNRKERTAPPLPRGDFIEHPRS